MPGAHVAMLCGRNRDGSGKRSRHTSASSAGRLLQRYASGELRHDDTSSIDTSLGDLTMLFLRIPHQQKPESKKCRDNDNNDDEEDLFGVDRL